jgi:hypothetical protein
VSSAPPPVNFALSTYRLVLLSHGPRSADLDPATIAEIQGRHVQYQLARQAAGDILAAGALVGALDTGHRGTGGGIVGLGFSALPREDVLRLVAKDPGVQEGLYVAEVVEFMCPQGTIEFHNVAVPWH